MYRSSSVTTVVVHLSPPPVYAPEEQTEENSAASVDAGSVAEFISQTCVVLGIDRHIIAHDQIGQGHRHERSLHKAAAEPGRMRIPLPRLRHPIERPPNNCCEDQTQQR